MTGVLDFGGGWSPSLTMPEAADDFDQPQAPSASPDQMLIAGISGRRLDWVTDALAQGASVSQKVGRERLVAHVVRHFDPEIAAALTKAKMSWKDISAFWPVMLATDAAPALTWIISNTPWSKILASSPTKPSADQTRLHEMINSTGSAAAVHMLHAWSLQCDEVLPYLVKRSNMHWFKGIWSSAIQSNHQAVCEWFFPGGPLEKHGKDLLTGWLLDAASWRKSPVSLCSVLENLFAPGHRGASLWSAQFPRPMNLSISSSEGTFSRAATVLGPFLTKLSTPPSSSYGSYQFHGSHTTTHNVIDVLVRSGALMLKDIAQHPAGRSAILESLSRPTAALSFAIHSDPSSALALCKVLGKDAIEWRDEHGNTLAHYLSAVTNTATNTSMTKSLSSGLMAIDLDWLSALNDAGQTPMSGWPQEMRMQVDKRVLKSSLKGVIPQSVVAPKRRM